MSGREQGIVETVREALRGEEGASTGTTFMRGLTLGALIGAGSLSDRLLTGPAVAVLGFDAPAIAGSSNQIVPFARARVSLRIAPGDDPVAARQALVNHLRSHAPWGV